MAPKPYKGKRAPAANSDKATKLPKFKKKKSKAADGGESDGSPRRKRSVWGLVGLIAGLASLFVLAVDRPRRQKRAKDRKILDGMRRRPVVYTEHAACRMDCRFVGKPEVLETLEKGRINDRKSELRPRDSRYPKYTVDATVGPKSKNVQVVFSACPDATRVVTVIDRDTNWPCPVC